MFLLASLVSFLSFVPVSWAPPLLPGCLYCRRLPSPSCRYIAQVVLHGFSTVLSNAFGLSGNGPPTAFSQASPTREDALAASGR